MARSPTPSDEELLSQLRAKDESALATLYARLGGGVYRFALRMSGSPSIAEDVTQEVFLALLGKPDRFDAGRGSVASFLYGVARNHVLKRLERERLVPFAPPPAPAADDALDALIRRERVALLWRALLTLPLHYREVVVLCELERLSYPEAASVLHCAVGTVRSRLHRGRELLTAKLHALGAAREREHDAV